MIGEALLDEVLPLCPGCLAHTIRPDQALCPCCEHDDPLAVPCERCGATEGTACDPGCPSLDQ